MQGHGQVGVGRTSLLCPCLVYWTAVTEEQTGRLEVSSSGVWHAQAPGTAPPCGDTCLRFRRCFPLGPRAGTSQGSWSLMWALVTSGGPASQGHLLGVRISTPLWGREHSGPAPPPVHTLTGPHWANPAGNTQAPLLSPPSSSSLSALTRHVTSSRHVGCRPRLLSPPQGWATAPDPPGSG